MSGQWRMTRRAGRKLLLATVTCIVAAAALAGPAASSTSSSDLKDGTVIYGSLPTVGTSAAGGTISVGQVVGDTPNYIFPIMPGEFTSSPNTELISNLFLPLYTAPDGARPQIDRRLDLANPPVASNGGRVYTITLKRGFHWSSGAPVDADDVVFSFDLLRAGVRENPENWGQYIPGQFPQSVSSISATGTDTVRITLNRPYNPNYFLYNQLQDTGFGLFALPSTSWNVDSSAGFHLDYTVPANAKRIYDYLSQESENLTTWTSNPLWKDVDGPYALKTFTPSSGAFTLVPNPSFGGSTKARATFRYESFPSSQAEMTALDSGRVDITNLLPSQLTDAPRLRARGYSIFGSPDWTWNGGIINFKDTTDDFDKVIAQTYVRAAIDHLINQPKLVSTVYHGAAVPSYTPVPSAPASPFTPLSATHPAYGYDPKAAVALLTAHGWAVKPGGKTVCARAGTGPSDCGTGIPTGTPIAFVWANDRSPVDSIAVDESTPLAAAAKRYAGIDITLQVRTFAFLNRYYNDQNPAAAKYTDDWGVNNYGGFYENDYPTQSGVESEGAAFNLGDYGDATSQRLIDSSVSSTDPKAVEAEVNYLAKDPPVFYMPDLDGVVAVSKRVGGSADGFLSLTQFAAQLEYLYVKR